MGRVKWFDPVLGYGFLTCVDDPVLCKHEVFVHFKALHCSAYRTLSKGEYVSFEVLSRKDLATVDNKSDGVCAINVTGVANGPLLCESNIATPNLLESAVYVPRGSSIVV